MKKITYQLPTLTDRRYQNPCKAEGLSKPPTAPDPYIIKFNGMFYLYATAQEGIKILSSKDMITWKFEGFSCPKDGQRQFWAPSVIYWDGRFYAYYSCIDGDAWENLCVASSDSPTGPFRFEKMFFDFFSIDSHVVRDTDGKYYLYYMIDGYNGSKLYDQGTSILMDELLDPVTLAGNPIQIAGPTIEQEIFEKNRFAPNVHWHTIEGPFYFNRNGRDFMMYSGNCFMHEDYFVGYSTTIHDTNRLPMPQKKWRKYPDDYTYRPLMRRNDTVEGTGHNSVVKSLDNTEYWAAYHARPILKDRDPGDEERLGYIDRLFFDGDEIWSAIPTDQPQDAPALPYLFDRFDDKALSNWDFTGGTWKTENNTLIQKDNDAVYYALTKETFENYIFELYTKPVLSSYGPAYGICLSYTDDANCLLLKFAPRREFAEIIQKTNGIETVLQTVTLDKGFRFDVWHGIRIHKSANNFRIELDDFEVAAFEAARPAGKLGMFTCLGSCAFSAAAITKFTSSYRANLAPLFQTDDYAGFFLQDSSGITYKTAQYDQVGRLTYDRPIGDCFEMEVAVETRTSSETYTFSVEFSDQMSLAIDGTTKTITIGGEALPFWAGFQMRAPHYLHIRRRKDQMYVILDQHCIYEGVCSGKSKFSLACNNCICLSEFSLKEV